ncbi:MAG: UDP-N-acetylmuramoyl-L-alanine--D-glutamate ligase [Atopobiaceae bacterium]
MSEIGDKSQRLKLGRVCVLGLGKTAVAAAEYLLGPARERVDHVVIYGGAKATMGAAAKHLESLGARVCVGTDELDEEFDLAIASPGIPPKSAFFQSAHKHSLELIGEPEFAWRESPERWIGITGTNGKTTTTTLTAHLMESAHEHAYTVGNIGTAAISKVDARPAGSWFVAELSSFQLEETRLLHPHVAALLNITPDHVEWHGSLEAYAAAKEKIFQNFSGQDLAVISEEDAWCQAIISRLEARGVNVCHVNVHRDPQTPYAAFAEDGMLKLRDEAGTHELARASELPLRGEHNVQNVLVASMLALRSGVAIAAIQRGLASFHALEHRIEPAGDIGGVHFVNDSKATNTDSVEKALTAFEPGHIVILLGGHDKMCDLTSMAEAVVARCSYAICFGEAKKRFTEALRDAGAVEAPAAGAAAAADADTDTCHLMEAAHLKDAFACALTVARPHDTVLLSPACSSFDEFSNYEERGRYFKDLVRDSAQRKERK